MYLTSSYDYFCQGGIESMSITEVFGGKYSMNYCISSKSQWYYLKAYTMQ